MNSEDKQAWPDLAGRALGGSVVYANDELFAERENLIKPEAPSFRPHTFGHKGQIMDGWETRRRREPGNDERDRPARAAAAWCAGSSSTRRYFTGNYPPEVSVEACGVGGLPVPGRAGRRPTGRRSSRAAAVAGDTSNEFEVDAGPAGHPRSAAHVPRRRGGPAAGPRRAGARPAAAARHHRPGRAGERRRRRPAAATCSTPPPPTCSARARPGSWARAGRPPGAATTATTGWRCGWPAPGRVEVVELDTSHFVGNAPGWATLSGDGPGDGRTCCPAPRCSRTPGTASPCRAGR